MSTTRTITIAGAEVTYRGSVGEIEVGDGTGGPGARYVYTEYVREDLPESERTTRPVLFAFNGGPGSSSVWTHLGIGPRRVAEADSLRPPMSPPFSLVDNEDSPLDAMDLVFIDPPGTGYSRIRDGVETERFFGVEQDAGATLEFIGHWVRRNRREQSPRFIAGESYGTLRAARVARLANGGPFHGGRTRPTSISGALVLGPAFGLGETAWSGDVEAALSLPTLVRTARHHGAAVAESDDELAQFAREQLLPALASGTTLTDQARSDIAARIAGLLGLPVSQILARDLRVSAAEFAKLVLADRGLHVGMYDSRFTLASAAAGVDPVADDPGMGVYMPQFTGVIERYLRDELHYETDDEYRSIDFRITMQHWDYDGQRMPQSNCFGEFAEVLRRDERFELLIAVGDYDLVTTREAAAFALTRFRFDRDRVHLRTYASGHMPYLGAAPRRQLGSDIRAFVLKVAGSAR